MNGKKTPLMQVNDEHGGKTKLVDKILGSMERGEEDEGTLKARLLKASNKKLLRLLAVSSTIREKYGSAEKLAEAVGGKLNRIKDKDYMAKLGGYAPARLLDMARSLGGERRRPLKLGTVAKAAPAPTKAKPAAAKGKKAAAAKKAPAKKASPAARKPTAKKTTAKKGARS
jgi:hypothetical protein